MISETDTIILQNLKGVLKTKQKELEGQRKPKYVNGLLCFECSFVLFW